jgi:hypothetical protein
MSKVSVDKPTYATVNYYMEIIFYNLWKLFFTVSVDKPTYGTVNYYVHMEIILYSYL